MDNKKWYASKTIWFNVAVALVAIGNEMLPVVAVLEPETADIVRPWLIVATSVGNVLLRTITQKPVKP